MAVVSKVPTVATKDPPGKTLFAQSISSADVAGEELVKAAVSGKSIYITHIVAGLDGDAIVDIGDGDAGTAVDTIAFQLVSTATGVVYDIKFDNPIKLTADKAMRIDSSAACRVSLLVEGFVA